jgi:hypothetical protein
MALPHRMDVPDPIRTLVVQQMSHPLPLPEC